MQGGFNIYRVPLCYSNWGGAETFVTVCARSESLAVHAALEHVRESRKRVRKPELWNYRNHAVTDLGPVEDYAGERPRLSVYVDAFESAEARARVEKRRSQFVCGWMSDEPRFHASPAGQGWAVRDLRERAYVEGAFFTGRSAQRTAEERARQLNEPAAVA